MQQFTGPRWGRSPADDGTQLDIFQAARAGDCAQLARLLKGGADVNTCDRWDSFPLYYACLAGHDVAARKLLEAGAGAIFAESTFEADRCYRAAPNLKIQKLLREYEVRPLPPPPSLARLSAALRSAPPDITLYVQGRPIEAHRVILAARSPYFRTKLATEWGSRREVRLSSSHIYVSFDLMRSLVDFFYSDRVDLPADDVEAFARICRACQCQGLLQRANRFLAPRRCRETQQLDRCHPPRRFVWQARCAQDRLPSALRRILYDCLANSREEDLRNNEPVETCAGSEYDDLADTCVKVGERVFRCHQLILASRSEYFKTRLFRRTEFLERHHGVLEEHDVSAEAFEKMLVYIYTDEIEDLGDDPLAQAEELLDVASRYLMYRLKGVVADLLIPHLDMDRISPAQLCRWLTLSDMYDVAKIREYCLHIIACNFEAFAEAREFQALLLASRTSAPAEGQGDLLNDLRQTWLAARLDRRNESAALFEKRLEMVLLAPRQGVNGDQRGFSCVPGRSRTSMIRRIASKLMRKIFCGILLSE
ncbi:hypothetical protein QYE76_063301 [Lolium multiflorum]|uniref:BTB domain-containing protein n=1 Tax=Lolium multiflorum TaxID=4521 RepID=A0AAD8W6F4_LOLMU|nr:hypothetical protein QYE76_063301 [Lolium multiflorum]